MCDECNVLLLSKGGDSLRLASLRINDHRLSLLMQIELKVVFISHAQIHIMVKQVGAHIVLHRLLLHLLNLEELILFLIIRNIRMLKSKILQLSRVQLANLLLLHGLSRHPSSLGCGHTLTRIVSNLIALAGCISWQCDLDREVLLLK